MDADGSFLQSCGSFHVSFRGSFHNFHGSFRGSCFNESAHGSVEPLAEGWSITTKEILLKASGCLDGSFNRHFHRTSQSLLPWKLV